MRMGYTWGSAPIDPFTSPHTSGIAPTVSAKHGLCSSFVFDFPPTPTISSTSVWLTRVAPTAEGLSEGVARSPRSLIGSSFTLRHSWTVLPALLPVPRESSARLAAQPGRVAAAACLILLLWSLSHIRRADNPPNLQSVKARHKFSPERLWHCQAELEKN